MLSLAISGALPNLRYSVVIRKEPGAPAWDFHMGAEKSEHKAFTDDMKAQQFYPSIVVARGEGAATRYAAVYVKDDLPNGLDLSKERLDLTLAQLQSWTKFFQTSRLWYLDWLSAHGSGQSLRFNAVFKRFPEPNSVYWNFDIGADNLMGYGELIDHAGAWRAGWTRPHCIAMSDEKRYGVVFHDDVWDAPKAKSMYIFANHTKQTLQDQILEQQSDLYFPVRIFAAGVGADTRYAAIFARIDQPVEREWVAHHPSQELLSSKRAPDGGRLDRPNPSPDARIRKASRRPMRRRDARIVRPNRLYDPRVVELGIPPLATPVERNIHWERQGGGGPGSGDALPPNPDQPPVAPGKTTPVALDEWMKTFMQHWGIRGAALAVARHGKLVFAGGYKWAEPDYPSVPADSRFRVGSLSKTITAVATMQLHEEFYEQGVDLMGMSVQDPGMLELEQLNGKDPRLFRGICGRAA